MVQTRQKRAAKPEPELKSKDAARTKKQKQKSSSEEVAKTEDDSAKETTTGSTGSSSGDILNYLLLDATLDAISPPEVLGAKHESDLRYPHSDLSPFCSLVSALLLSKPFSHRLGMRAIHTVLNAPYSFTTPRAVLDAGSDSRWQALMDAHTLHKEKSSGQLRDLSELIKAEYGDDFENGELAQFRAKADGDVAALQAQVCQIKGFAEKTCSLFFRRVQLQWTELFPYADDLAIDAAKEMGLEVSSARDLLGLVRTHLGNVEGEELRRKFIRVLEVLIGKKLDKDIGRAKDQVAELDGAESKGEKAVEPKKESKEEIVDEHEVKGKETTGS